MRLEHVTHPQVLRFLRAGRFANQSQVSCESSAIELVNVDTQNFCPILVRHSALLKYLYCWELLVSNSYIGAPGKDREHAVSLLVHFILLNHCHFESRVAQLMRFIKEFVRQKRRLKSAERRDIGSRQRQRSFQMIQRLRKM